MRPVLVVGVRSPVALELVRQLHYHGLVVEGADFLHFPLGRFSCRLERYHRLPSPRWQNAEFQRAWEKLLSRSYAAVFACNEEIFWVSRCSSGAWDRPEVLEQLHRKDSFVKLLASLSLPAPRTQPLDTWDGSGEVVLKRVYSRFGESTRLDPTREQIQELRPQPGWLVQQKLEGPQLCFTGFAWRGELLCGCCYQSRWGNLSGQAHGGAGLHFQKCDAPELRRQAAHLVARLSFSGPIGLDFVGETAVECNPRWTSGIHLFDLTPVLDVLNLPTRPGWVVPDKVQLAAPMLLRAKLRKDFWSDWLGTRDAIWETADPGPALAQPLALLETLWRVKRQKISLSQALTWDIEWNGPGDIA